MLCVLIRIASMSTHNIPFSIQKKKITQNYPKSADKGIFLGTQERVRNSHGKRVISVRATEVLLYYGHIDSALIEIKIHGFYLIMVSL